MRGRTGREKCHCGREAHARGLCQRHYRQQWREEQRANECAFEGCRFGREPESAYCVTHGPEMEMRMTIAALRERGVTFADLTHYGEDLQDAA